MENKSVLKLTKSVIDKIKPDEGKDQRFYRDEQLKGFALRVTANGMKSFVVETRIAGKVKRMTIGKYGAITAEEARKQAKQLLGQIAKGDNPIAEKKANKIKTMTLDQVFHDYLKARKDLKSLTIKDYQGILKQVVPDWLDKPLLNITREMIAKRHAQYGQTNSKARANYAMRVLRAVFNFAVHEYQLENGQPVIAVNPVEYLSHARSWFRVDRKNTVIKNHQLAAWHEGLTRLGEHDNYPQAMMWKDYFLLILFTGLRRMEAASLLWRDIDFKAKTFTVQDTKNREVHTLPMSDFLYELFLRRKQFKSNEYVFPAPSRTGHIVEPRKAMLRVAELSGIPFTIHDLRRTFATTAESLDLSAYALKRLLNHKMTNDVTAGYIMRDVERLRIPMQRITDFLMKQIVAHVEIE
ncbi:tyrosine-type recombinase/integrase [Legionella spiritensis]|uniref:tyrosine-type recombinase/integrase n=1 Tax=Legionella spiritensis TaxID=452 RepID=UPI000F6DD95A|nr:integrase arm-type DNA-binding domain-containing protein [Legionella spiritensis]VEG92508.1 phage related integrase [Legionella spiritensis]VEG92587.1 phage related integrase [Legionella spiritensis]